MNRGGAENQLLILINEQLGLGYNVRVTALKGDSELSSELNTLGVEFTDLTKKTFLWQIRTLRKMYFDGVIVHSHLPRAEIISWLAFLGKENTWIISRHNAEKFWPKRPKLLSSWLSRILTRRADAVVAISNEVSRYLKESKEISKEDIHKLRVVKYGIPMNYGRESSRKFEQFGFRVGIAARLEPQKDVATLIDAFSSLKRDSASQWSLSIAGSGSLLPSLERQVNELGLSHSVTFLGKVADMRGFYKSLDIFVLSSKYEGFGLVLLEAMLENIPIISSDMPTAREILGEGYAPLFPIGDSHELAKLIDSMSDPQIRLMACSQYKTRLPFFDSKHMSKAMSKVYQSI